MSTTTRKLVRLAFEKSLKTVDPRTAVREALSMTPSHLTILNSSTFPISNFTKIILISFGKASIQMASGAQEVILKTSPEISKNLKTFIVAPEAQKTSSKLPELFNAKIWFGAKNNLPDFDAVEATQKLISEIRSEDSKDTVFIFLISGGGSALLTAPRDTVTLEEKLRTIMILQAHGATIQELNLVRQKLSEVKGGRLLRNIQKGSSISLIISDVIGNPMNLIASGPTVIQENSESGISEILTSLGILETDLPESVRKVLRERNEPITPPPHLENHIISSNDFALRAASESLTSSGFHTKIVTSSLSGNAAEIGRRFADLIYNRNFDGFGLDSPQHLQYPMALLFGGETTVILAKNSGLGGRNQEMVLSLLDSLNSKIQNSKNPNFLKKFTFLSAGTDGQDGPTDAAGALISEDDLLNPMTSTSSKFLKNSDSYNFWKSFNNGKSHLKTGPTGTNVMDMQILVLE